jgi:transposase
MQDYIAKGQEIFIGLEDSKRTWKICVRRGGLEVQRTSMPADFEVLQAYLRKRYPDCHIHLIYEAGFKGFGLYDKLSEIGVDCIVVPPHLVTEAKVNKVKTDKRDARRLAKILEAGDYGSCHVPDVERREDRQYSRTLVGIQKDIVATKNRIKMMLHFHGIKLEFADKSTWTPKHFHQLRELQLSESVQICLGVLLDQLEWLWQAREALRTKLRELTQKQRYAKTFSIVQSLPGIGWFTAIRLVLEWGEDLSRFHSGQAIASFVGLTASENSTGERVQRGGITHMGSGFVRRWLIESAWTAIRRDPVLLDKYQRVLRSCGKKKTAIVAVARMLVVRLRACAVSGQSYQLGVVQ